MNMIQKLKKSKKGFTLVELLVVLVILAILAAAIIPSMMGFIDKAKEESAAAECRNVILAADIVLNELYGEGKLATVTSETAIDIVKPGSTDEIIAISGLKGGISDIKVKPDTGTKHFVVSSAKYEPTDGNNTYSYDGTTWTRDGAAPTATPGA